jgi:hypothetical protein
VVDAEARVFGIARDSLANGRIYCRGGKKGV